MATNSTTEPITTARATRNERFDIGELTLLAGAVRVEPRLENERGGLLIDHLLAFVARQIGSEQHALRFGGRETLVLLVQFHRVTKSCLQRGHEFLHPLRAMP